MEQIQTLYLWNTSIYQAQQKVRLYILCQVCVTALLILADGGIDVLVQSGMIEFAPGSQLAAIDVPITDDTLAEPNEDFVVMLTTLDATAVTISAAITQVTITDDDGTYQY